MRNILFVSLLGTGLVACAGGPSGGGGPSQAPAQVATTTSVQDGVLVQERHSVVEARPVTTRGGEKTRNQIVSMPGLPGVGDVGF